MEPKFKIGSEQKTRAFGKVKIQDILWSKTTATFVYEVLIDFEDGPPEKFLFYERELE